MKTELYVTPAVEVVEIMAEKIFVGSDGCGGGTLEDMNRDDWGGSWSY